MKKIIAVVLGIVFILLDWAALHDIIKQNEDNYTAEFGVIFLSIIYFSAFIIYRRNFIFENSNTGLPDKRRLL